MYDEVKVTVPMIVRYVHNDKIKVKRNSEYRIVPLRDWQLDDEVKCYCFEGCGFRFGIYGL
jgi:hypothetical protein